MKAQFDRLLTQLEDNPFLFKHACNCLNETCIVTREDIHTRFFGSDISTVDSNTRNFFRG
jgi:hypothetical protein